MHNEMIKVKDCIEGKSHAVKRGTPLKDIIRLLKEKEYSILPVVNKDNRLVGKITLEDITSVFQPQSSHINKLLETVPYLDSIPHSRLDIEFITPEMGILVVADEIMSTDYFSVSPEDSIVKAYSIMRKHSVGFLMVLNEDSVLYGVLGLFDIIYAILRQKGVVE